MAPTATAEPVAGELAVRFGALLQAHREALGISRRQLAADGGVASQVLLEVERGRANPTLARCEALAALYGVTIDLVVTSGPVAAVTSARIPRTQ